MADEEQKHEKPQLVLANTKKMTFEDCLNMYRRLMGKEPTPADVEKARKTWDMRQVLVSTLNASPFRQATPSPTPTDSQSQSEPR